MGAGDLFGHLRTMAVQSAQRFYRSLGGITSFSLQDILVRMGGHGSLALPLRLDSDPASKFESGCGDAKGDRASRQLDSDGLSETAFYDGDKNGGQSPWCSPTGKPGLFRSL